MPTATAVYSLLDPQSGEQQGLVGSTMTLAAVTRFMGALAGEIEVAS